MTLLGLDFDNTLVRYDKLFHQLALEKGLIKGSVPADKTAIRDYLRCRGQDEQFTELQGEVYGLRILEADPCKGMLEALGKLHERGIEMALVSHKTKTPYKGPKYDLRKSAWDWLTKHKFFEKGILKESGENVFFESSKNEKIQRIEMLKCTHYVDDLPEILEALNDEVIKIHYSPGIDKKEYPGVLKMENWEKINQLIN